MEIIEQLFAIAAVIAAFIGAISMIILLALVIMVRKGGFVQFGYIDEVEEETTNKIEENDNE